MLTDLSRKRLCRFLDGTRSSTYWWLHPKWPSLLQILAAAAVVLLFVGSNKDADEENTTLYGLLRLRFNDDPRAPSPVFQDWSRSAWGLGCRSLLVTELWSSVPGFGVSILGAFLPIPARN